MVGGMANALSPEFSRQLDGLRGLAALLVLVAHAAQLFWLPFVAPGSAVVDVFATAARHAVLVFFLLSGYLIAHGIRRNRAAGGCFDFRSYLLARLARLWPPLAGALLLTGLAVLAFDALAADAGLPFALHAQPSEFLRALLFVGGLEQGNPALWSLYVEARLYLVAGLLAWGLSCRGGRHPASVAAVLLAALCVWESAHFLLFGFVWAVGAFCALAPTAWQLRRRQLAPVLWGLAVCVLAVEPGWLSVRGSHSGGVAWMQALAGLLYAGVLFDLRWPAWVVSAPARVAGFAYTLYLVHWPLLVLLMAGLQPSVAHSLALAAGASALGLMASLFLARALAALLEQPARYRAWLLRLGQHGRQGA